MIRDNFFKSFKSVWFLPVLVVMNAGCSYAADDEVTAVPVGKGSYASAPPEDTKGVVKDIPTRDLYIIGPDRPVPTNKWWTDVIVSKYAGRLWAFPHQVETNKDGVNFTFPNRWNDEGRDPVSEYEIKLQGEDFHPVDARAKEWGDWTLTYRLAENDNKYCDVTLGRGMPAMWLEYKGVTPTLRAGNGVKIFDESGGALQLPAKSGAIGLEYGNRFFGIYAADGTEWEPNDDHLTVNFAGDKTYLVVCPLLQKTDLKYMRQFAYAIPRDSRMDWTYDPVKAQVVTKWHVETQALQGTNKQVVQGWLPHHWRDTVNDLKFNGREYLSPRGTLKCTTGNDFQITYSFKGMPAFLPPPKKSGLANDYDESRMRDYLTRYATRKEYGDDTYWGGKHLTQLAHYMALAKEMNDPSYNALSDTLHTALEDWMTYTPGEKAHYFARYPKWHALVGFKASYGSEGFNDQHFHYGYITTAAAILGLYDPQFLKDYGPMLKLVAKEYANWDRNDKDFPVLRTFDVWEGHSWAGGFSGGTGNNQESSSEAMQSWAGLFWLGEAMGDDKMTATGAMGYIMESRAIREYWFNVHGDVWSPNYKHPVVGMIWGGGQMYGTYFSGDPAWIYGIQWLPMSPGLAYLVEDPEYAKNSMRAMFDDRREKEGKTEITTMGPGLGNVILAQAAQINPNWVAQQMDELWDSNDKVAHDNDTPGLTYAFAHTNRILGNISWDFWSDMPLSRVYFNDRTKTWTYMAFNPKDTAQTATFYQDGKKAGTLKVPPHDTVVANQLGQ